MSTSQSSVLPYYRLNLVRAGKSSAWKETTHGRCEDFGFSKQTEGRGSDNPTRGNGLQHRIWSRGRTHAGPVSNPVHRRQWASPHEDVRNPEIGRERIEGTGRAEGKRNNRPRRYRPPREGFGAGGFVQALREEQ